MSGILKWVEPHRGSGYITNEDTGLCNRIYHWELGYQIAKINNMKIEVQKMWWPELEFLNLPLTSFLFCSLSSHAKNNMLFLRKNSIIDCPLIFNP